MAVISTEEIFFSKAYLLSSDNNNDIEECLPLVREKGFISLNQRCDTLVHFLAIKGNVAAFRVLIEEGLLSIEVLRKKNVKGCTALHEAARYGQKEVAEIMVMQDIDLVRLKNEAGETPLYIAAEYGKDEVFTVLEDFGSDCFAKRNDGCTVLHAAIDGEHYRLAISILCRYPGLAEEDEEKGMSALNLLGTKKWSSFKSRSDYTNFSRSEPFKLSEPYSIGPVLLPIQLVEALFYCAIPVMYVESENVVNLEEQQDLKAGGIIKRERSFWLQAILGLPWLRRIDSEKQKHGLALLLAERLISKEDWSCYTNSSHFDFPTNPKINPLIQATKLGITELVTAILKAHPQVSDSLDENGRNILHIAVEQKHLCLYEYLKKKLGHDKDRMLAEVDKYGNTILHLASNLGVPSIHSSLVPLEESNTDIAREMCWDVYWLKHTRMDCHLHLRYVRNKDGKTADELFEEKHLRLRKEAQKESVNMINSIIVVATLFCTVNYAALFTVPGGFEPTSGVPVLDKDYTFYQFIVVVYSAIFFSFISLAALLSLQRSSFYAEEFYISLPLKASAASICLMLAAVFTITASALALVLESKRANSFILLCLLPSGFTLINIFTIIDMSYRIFENLYYNVRDLLFSL